MAASLPQPQRFDWRLAAILIGVVLVLGLAAWLLWPTGNTPMRQRVIQEITLVQPPPPPPPEPEEKIMEEEEIVQPTDKPQEQKDVEPPKDEPTNDKPVEQASEPSGLDKPADSGSDSFRLAAGGGGGLFGRGGGGGGNGDGGWGAYVETHVRRALRLDPRTRSAQGSLRVTLNIEPSGRISGAALRSSTGNAELDAAIRNVLSSLPPLARGRPTAIGGLTYTTIDMKRISG